MAVANGFGKVVTSGSVFMYDTGDTVNSYIGEPTTNYIPNADLISGWTTYYRTLALSTFTTEFGTTGYRFVNQPSWNGIYRNFTLPTTGTYTFSAWFRYNGGSANNNGATVYIHNYGGGDTAAGLNKNLIGVWQRVSHTITVSSPSNVYFFLISYGGVDNGTGNPDYSSWEVTMPQIELKSHVTPFVNGTRSATQGLLPVVGNSTIDLSSVSFDSNAQFFWDGTDDTLAVNDVFSHKPNLPFSYEIIVYPLGSDSGTDKMLLGKPGWHTGIMYQSGYTWFRTRYGNPAFYDAGSYLLSPGNYYHLTAVYVPETSMKFYVNGVLNGENTSVSSPLTDIGNTLNIGGSSTNYSCYVKIPVAKVYNRALSAAEVQQNYNKYKSRFNLS